MKLLWMVIYWLKGVWLGIKATRREQLGSRVWHDGRWWFVSNWSGSEAPTLSEGSRNGRAGEYREHVPRCEIKQSRSPAEFIHRFRTIRRWYMGYWYRIDVNRQVYGR